MRLLLILLAGAALATLLVALLLARRLSRPIDALVARIYVGLKPALIPMARESVLAHLRKLADDGIARQDGEAWALY